MEPGASEPNQSPPPPDGSKRPKRQMKTPFQLEVLEKTYSSMYLFLFSANFSFRVSFCLLDLLMSLCFFFVGLKFSVFTVYW